VAAFSFRDESEGKSALRVILPNGIGPLSSLGLLWRECLFISPNAVDQEVGWMLARLRHR
jgi:hypothetical protein